MAFPNLPVVVAPGSGPGESRLAQGRPRSEKAPGYVRNGIRHWSTSGRGVAGKCNVIVSAMKVRAVLPDAAGPI